MGGSGSADAGELEASMAPIMGSEAEGWTAGARKLRQFPVSHPGRNGHRTAQRTHRQTEREGAAGREGDN